VAGATILEHLPAFGNYQTSALTLCCARTSVLSLARRLIFSSASRFHYKLAFACTDDIEERCRLPGPEITGDRTSVRVGCRDGHSCGKAELDRRLSLSRAAPRCKMIA